MIFEEAAQIYLQRMEQRHCGRRHFEQSRQLLVRICNVFGSTPVQEMDAQAVFTWLNAQGWSPRTMRSVASRIGAVLQFADGPELNLRQSLPRPERKRPETISLELHASLVDAASDSFADVLRMLWAVPMPLKSLCAATTEHIEDDELGMKLVFDGRVEHVYCVPPKTAAMVRTLIAANGDGPIFRNRNGGQFHSRTLTSALGRVRSKLGLRGVSLRSYRRTAGLRLRRHGIQDYVIRAILGQHNRSCFGLDRYVVLSEERLFEAAKLLEIDAHNST